MTTKHPKHNSEDRLNRNLMILFVCVLFIHILVTWVLNFEQTRTILQDHQQLLKIERLLSEKSSPETK